MTVARHALSDIQWTRVQRVLPAPKWRRGNDDRKFIEAVLWIAKTGAPWRDLPERFGGWAPVYQRFARWSHAGYFELVFNALGSPGLEEIKIDSTHCKAHQSSAGAQKKGALSLLASLGEA